MELNNKRSNTETPDLKTPLSTHYSVKLNRFRSFNILFYSTVHLGIFNCFMDFCIFKFTNNKTLKTDFPFENYETAEA